MNFRFRIGKKRIVFCAGFVAIVAAASAASAQQPNAREAVQESFSAEDEGVKRPVTIPNEVMKILAQDDMVRTQMQNDETRPTEVPASWFSASEIRLGRTPANDLVIQAAGPLVGANVDIFWVFVHAHDEWKLALEIPAHDLIVMRRRFNRYRILEADAMPCCMITTARFRFDGTRYERYFARTQDIK